MKIRRSSTLESLTFILMIAGLGLVTYTILR